MNADLKINFCSGVLRLSELPRCPNVDDLHYSVRNNRGPDWNRILSRHPSLLQGVSTVIRKKALGFN